MRLTDHEDQDNNPSWSPDDSAIAFETHRAPPPGIFIVNADGSGLRRLTPEGLYALQPAWSPDGTKIAFAAYMKSNENPKKHGITWKSGFEEYNEEIGVMALELPLDDSWDEDVERWRAGKVETVVRTAEENAAAMKDFYDTCGLSSPMPFSSEE